VKLLAALSVMFSLVGNSATPTAAEQRPARPCTNVIEAVKDYRAKTWKAQAVLGLRKTTSAKHEQWAKSCKYIKWIRDLWWNRARKAHKLYRNPPHYYAWICIHSYEGSWTDPGSPYYGGLQMDYGFQQAYGWQLLQTKGTADHWTPLEQMWVAERAYQTRGFYPWPTTARFCHLI
jgi:hypothetical protein